MDGMDGMDGVDGVEKRLRIRNLILFDSGATQRTVGFLILWLLDFAASCVSS